MYTQRVKGSRRRFLLEMGVFLVALYVMLARVPHFDHFLSNADHGYQLASGAELLRGRLPGVDSLSHQGPLIAVLTAATLRATGNLVAEALLCATAWALSVSVAYSFTRRHFGLLAGWVAGISGLLCVARFHKWYMWLLPLAALSAVSCASSASVHRRWGLTGLVCGIGALLRPELGLAAFGVVGVLALAETLCDEGVRWPPGWLPLVAGFAVLPAIWMMVIAALAGPGAIPRALETLPVSVSGPLDYWSLPPPQFRFEYPLSTASAQALALGLLPSVEIVAIVLGALVAYMDRGLPLASQGRCLVAIGLMGLAFYPHAIYRADIPHLWQGVWPLLVAVPAICSVAIRFARSAARRGRSVLMPSLATTGGFVLAGLTAVALVPLAKLPHPDLPPIRSAPLAGLKELRDGLSAIPNHPLAQVVATIDRLSKPTDEILVVSAEPQLLVFADRPASGLCFVYLRGIFDSPRWRREHLARLEQNPPALVVATRRFFSFGPDEDFRATQPEMYEFLRAHYKVVAVEQTSNFVLLAPADGGGASG